MADGPHRIYWDADVFLSYVNGLPDRLPTIETLLTLARVGARVEIVTSTLSITEVAFAHAEQSRGRPDPVIEQILDSLWSDAVLRLAQLTVPIARAARQPVRASLQTAPRLKPPDAFHLATAERLDVTEFHTYDADLHRYAGRFGFPIHVPTAPTPSP
jgi:predicted nucleic acid-binding protein